MKRATAVRHYTIRRVGDDELLARARVLWVWVDLESGQPIRIPAEFRQDFAPNIS
jgi:acyl-CoA thioesterase FadM